MSKMQQRFRSEKRHELLPVLRRTFASMMMMNAPKRALCSFRVVEEEKKFVVVDTSHHMHT